MPDKTDKLGHDIEEAIEHQKHHEPDTLAGTLLRWWDSVMDSMGLTHLRSDQPHDIHDGSHPINRLASLRDIVKDLDPPLDEATFTELFKLQTEMWTAHDQMTARLERQEMTPEKYLDDFNALMRTDMEKCLALLGDERFDAIFGEAGRHPESMLDRDTFLSQWGIR